MRLIAGFLKPSAGSIIVDGLDPWVHPMEIHTKMGILTENHGNYEELTVWENLDFFGRFYKLDHLDERIEKMLKLMHLQDRRTTRVGKLSKGLKQRAALARVLLHDPPLLLLDEATTGLDPQSAADVHNYIKQLKSRDRTIVINSHNLDEVQKICDRFAVLDKGQLKVVGNIGELNSNLWYAHEIQCCLGPPVPDNLASHFTNIDSIKEVSLDGNLLKIRGDDLEQITPQIVVRLVDCGCKVLEVKQRIHSLEEIYFRLMDEVELDKEMANDPILRMAEEEASHK